MSLNHPAFRFIRSIPIEALRITVQEFEHIATGAMHYHIDAQNTENVFLVALRTVPMDNKGVAHILEHTALCGSKRYPVRDPFFMMTRRSLNTFMNAFTSNDWTAYPFASQNRKDFDNLLSVYLDAVFFSRLHELDFKQEGHRLEFKEASNSQSELMYKGVVFNEMKGAMSSVSSVLWQSLCKYLFPSTTYHYNSGGDPEYITDLTYQELKDFYARHYHPSNAIFMTYGDISAFEHQEKFENLALSQFERGDTQIKIEREKRFLAPLYVEEAYACDNPENEPKDHIILAWLLGDSTQLQDTLKAQLLNYILLENSACPLQLYLETTELGAAPSPLCGVEDSYREIVFCCGISDGLAKDADQLEQEILALLKQTAEEGISEDRLNAILRQIELSHREVRGDGMPYGLQLILSALGNATHRGDPVDLLDLSPALIRLKEQAKAQGFVKNLIEELLLNNLHRVRLVMTADNQLAEKRINAEKQQLAQIKSGLSEADKQAIIDQAAALAARQMQIDDENILPKVTLADIQAINDEPSFEKTTEHQFEHYFYAQGTNGLSYQQLILPLPPLADPLVEFLPLYSQCLTELGIGEKTYTEVQHLQSEVVGSISAYTSMRSASHNEQDFSAYLVVSAKALTEQQTQMMQLLKQTLQDTRFDELDRLSDIVSQNKNRGERSISGNGHVFAMRAASAGLSPLAKLNEQHSGLTAIAATKALDKKIKQQGSGFLSQSLSAIHQAMQSAPVKILSIAEDNQKDAIQNAASTLWQNQNASYFDFALPLSRHHQQVAWLCDTQVSFCSKAFASVPAEHEDSAALVVLGGFLRNGFLHTAIREKGGAYGAGARQDNGTASFCFYSYRDPRISDTLADFDTSITWLLENAHNQTQLEEAILGVIASIDKPSSPQGAAKQAFYNHLFGRTLEQQARYREKILAVSLDDLKRVAKTYLYQQEHSTAVVSHAGMRGEIEQLGLDIHVL